MTERRTFKTIVWAACCCFLLYVAITVAQMFPEWHGLSSAASFALTKHLIVVLGIAAFLPIKPQIGSWAALAWGSIVPFERYSLLATEILRGSLDGSGALAILDMIRLLLLLVGTCLSALLVYLLHFHKKKTEDASSVSA